MKQTHCFSFRSGSFVIDTASLVLSERVRSRRLLWHSYCVKQITEGSHQARNLEEERRTLNRLRRESQDYLYLNVSHTCNMGCHYCFAKGGAYGEERQLMEHAVAREAINWLLQIGRGHQLTVNFFGGEPLLNLPVVRDIIDYARRQSCQYRKSFRALISTNGTIDFCELADVLCSVSHRITVSVDGDSARHDINRPFLGGGSSYRAIARNIHRYIQLAGNSGLSAKATWRRGQSDLISVAKSLCDLGFRHLNIGRETSFDGTCIQPLDNRVVHDFDEMISGYDGLAKWYSQELNRGHNIVVQPLHSIMQAVLFAQILRRPCPAGTSTWCVSPAGKIYPCHRFVDKPGYEAGHVARGKPDPTILAILPPYGYIPPACNSCWARYWCFSHSCVYLSAIGKDFNSLSGFCRYMRRFLEMVCYHVAALSNIGRETLRSAGLPPSTGD